MKLFIVSMALVASCVALADKPTFVRRTGRNNNYGQRVASQSVGTVELVEVQQPSALPLIQSVSTTNPFVRFQNVAAAAPNSYYVVPEQQQQRTVSTVNAAYAAPVGYYVNQQAVRAQETVAVPSQTYEVASEVVQQRTPTASYEVPEQRSPAPSASYEVPEVTEQRNAETSSAYEVPEQRVAETSSAYEVPEQRVATPSASYEANVREQVEEEAEVQEARATNTAYTVQRQQPQTVFVVQESQVQPQQVVQVTAARQNQNNKYAQVLVQPTAARTINAARAAPIEILSYSLNAPGAPGFERAFDYSYESANGIKNEAVGEMKVVDEAEVMVMRGSYEYVGEDGETYQVDWYADETGFHPTARHLPVPVEIPFPEQAAAVEAQVRFAAQQRSNAAAGATEVVEVRQVPRYEAFKF